MSRLRDVVGALTLMESLACTAPARDTRAAPSAALPCLLISAGDADGRDSDFLAVIDLRADSPTLGKVVATTPTGMEASLPHHMEYALPPAGEWLFMNAHHHERSMLVDVSNPLAPRIASSFDAPVPLRYPHDYTRTPTGTRLVGFLRSEGSSADTAETESPGNAGGIAEYSAAGELLRTASAGNWGGKPVRPYAFALLADIDRLVVTSAPMMESTWADVVQIYRYSDFTLLHTIDLPAGGRLGLLQQLRLHILPAHRHRQRPPAALDLLCAGHPLRSEAGVDTRLRLRPST